MSPSVPASRALTGFAIFPSSHSVFCRFRYSSFFPSSYRLALISSCSSFRFDPLSAQRVARLNSAGQIHALETSFRLICFCNLFVLLVSQGKLPSISLLSHERSHSRDDALTNPTSHNRNVNGTVPPEETAPDLRRLGTRLPRHPTAPAERRPRGPNAHDCLHDQLHRSLFHTLCCGTRHAQGNTHSVKPADRRCGCNARA